MASDNRPNKDKRRRQNQARRAAREARKAHAGEATSMETGDGDDVTPVTSSRAKASQDKGSGGSAASGGKPSSQERRAAAKARMAARYPIPGQRSMFMALMFAAVFTVMVLLVDHPITDTVDPDSERAQAALEDGDAEVDDDDELVLNDDGQASIIEYTKIYDEGASGPALAGVIALFPLAVVGAAYYFKDNKERRNLLWTGSMFVLTAFMIFTSPYSIYMLPTLVAAGVGVFQYRKAENAPRMEELRRQREARKAAKRGETVPDDDDAQVIEGEVVEDEIVEDNVVEDEVVDDGVVDAEIVDDGDDGDDDRDRDRDD